MSDEDLILEYRKNQSSDAFAILYERYAHLVIGTCMKYLKNAMESEDLTMQIFELLPSKILKHEIQHFKSWLYRLTTNECLMWLRKFRRELGIEEQLHLTTDDTSIATPEKEIKLQLLEGKLNELKQEQRQCLELFYLQERSYNQISLEMGIDIKQVKSAIQNGKRNLKLKLEEHDEFNGTE